MRREVGMPREAEAVEEAARALPFGIVNGTYAREKLNQIGAKIVRHGRSITFQMAEVLVRRALFQKILTAIAALRVLPLARS
jgi:hypothetical protein